MAREMKDSGIEWIGEIPKEWKVIKVKKLFHIGRGRVISKLELKENGYPVYSSQTKNNGILGYIETYDFDKSQITWTTDGANAGTVFLREGKYNCTNVCGTLLPKKENEKLKFIEFALKFITPYYKRADINGFKIMNNEMAEIPIIYPTLEEQEKIANYLDKKVTDIDLIIEKTKATIEDYKKYKQSIITEAVTKGLNPNVEMKDSGIEWIGEIPKHWEIKKLKYVIELNPKVNIKNISEESIVTFTPMDRIKNGYFINNKGIWKNNNSSYNNYQEDDIVMAKVTPCFENGNIAIMKNLYNNIGFGSSELFVLRSKNNIKNKYLFYFLRNDIFKKLGKNSMTGAGGLKRVSSEFILNFSITIPYLEEQQQIAEYLDKKVFEIDNLIAKKESLINEMEEYKKSLIYECVTGKKEIV
jgi:type I restriction enzyme S subunit